LATPSKLSFNCPWIERIDFTRFLWYRNSQDGKGDYYTTNEAVTYRFTRLGFGLICFPFLLSVVVRELVALKRDHPTAAPLIDPSMFMDDIVAGMEDGNGAINLYYELSSLMKTIRLPMDKWSTNSEDLKEVWKAEGQEVLGTTQVLGIDWNTESDTLWVDPSNTLDNPTKRPITKRRLLQMTAKFYDALGLFSPVPAVGKILFQETLCRGLQWEEIVLNHIGVRWHAWITSLPMLQNIHIPRLIATSGGYDNQIHDFCDASEKAYGAVLYIRSSHGSETQVQIVCSNRLGPLKKVTLPRIEIIEALVGARVLNYFCRETV
jgi:hypothetical protein